VKFEVANAVSNVVPSKPAPPFKIGESARKFDFSSIKVVASGWLLAPVTVTSVGAPTACCRSFSAKPCTGKP
jgi:hypothetical protein